MTGFVAADLLGLALARHLEAKHGASTVSVGFAPKWDIRFNDGLTVEVKFDGLAYATGLAAIEFWNTRSGASGILTTEAKTWIHCVPEDGGLRCFEVETKRLLKLVIESGEVKSGGNGAASVMKLVPLRALREIASEDYLLRGELVELVRQNVLHQQ